MQLEDKLYTSTEVAEILGVSLRSVYRYLEDGKLKAEVKTATGRHRFTKENIIEFLYPDGKRDFLNEEEPTKTPKEVREEAREVFREPIRETPKEQIREFPREPVKEPKQIREDKPVDQEEDQVDWLE